VAIAFVCTLPMTALAFASDSAEVTPQRLIRLLYD